MSPVGPTTPSASLNRTSGQVGTSVTITGSGFEAGATMSIRYDGHQVTSVGTNSAGGFQVAFGVPSSDVGNHTITVTDGENTVNLPFAVTSQALPSRTDETSSYLGLAIGLPVGIVVLAAGIGIPIALRRRQKMRRVAATGPGLHLKACPHCGGMVRSDVAYCHHCSGLIL